MHPLFTDGLALILESRMISTLMSGVVVGLLSPKTPNPSAKVGGGNNGFITGVVTENGVGVLRRVMCYHRMSGVLIKTTLSDDSGRYKINGLSAGVRYFITSIDEADESIQYNAVTQDLIVASEVTS